MALDPDILFFDEPSAGLDPISSQLLDELILELRDSLGALPLHERRKVPGLHPDRAPTIVAGTILLAEVLGVFGLGAFEASERDILWGVALADAP